MDKREEAKRLLNSYLEMLAKGQGLHWDSDNRAEVGEIVDLIINATLDELEQVFSRASLTRNRCR